MTVYEKKQSGVADFATALAIDGAVIVEDIEWRIHWTAEWAYDYWGEGVSVAYDAEKMEVRGHRDGREVYLPMPDWLRTLVIAHECRTGRDRISERIQEIAERTRSRVA